MVRFFFSPSISLFLLYKYNIYNFLTFSKYKIVVCIYTNKPLIKNNRKIKNYKNHPKKTTTKKQKVADFEESVLGNEGMK
jgi:hypothetical protein